MSKETDSIVGVWRVEVKGAPTPHHMYVFHEDGTFQQFNSHEGNQETSDTPGCGVWLIESDGSIRAKFGEFRLDRKTKDTTYGEVTHTLTVKDDVLQGSCSFNVYGVDAKTLLDGPMEATLVGSRLSL